MYMYQVKLVEKIKGEKKYEIACNNLCESARVKCPPVGAPFILHPDIPPLRYSVDCSNLSNVLK